MTNRALCSVLNRYASSSVKCRRQNGTSTFRKLMRSSNKLTVAAHRTPPHHRPSPLGTTRQDGTLPAAECIEICSKDDTSDENSPLQCMPDTSDKASSLCVCVCVCDVLCIFDLLPSLRLAVSNDKCEAKQGARSLAPYSQHAGRPD